MLAADRLSWQVFFGIFVSICRECPYWFPKEGTGRFSHPCSSRKRALGYTAENNNKQTHSCSLCLERNPFEAESLLIIFKNSARTARTTLLYYKCRIVRAVYGNNRCSHRESYKTWEYKMKICCLLKQLVYACIQNVPRSDPLGFKGRRYQ